MSKPKIKCYFDVVSPFSYMGYWALETLPSFKDCERTYVPIFLGALLKMCDNRTPIAITNKSKWIDKERLRWRQLFDVPMQEELPENYPPLTITAQRALTVIQTKYPELLPKATTALFTAFWLDHIKIGDSDAIFSVLEETVGKEIAKDALDGTRSQEVKDRLVQNTKEAFDNNAFGLPWFEATNSDGVTESFWGFDHLGQVTDFLGLEKPNHGGWKALL